MALGVALLFLIYVVVRNAWVCDDAYITFRTVFNFAEGYGPVYNIDERVQTFTNPLWMLLVSIVYLVSDEVYFTNILLSVVLTTCCIYLFVARIAHWTVVAFFSLLLLGTSKAFVEFSTSGMENALTHLLVVLFAWVHLEWDEAPDKLLWLSVIAGLGALNRIDTILLFAPGLAWAFWTVRSRRSVAQIALGFLPFAVWELFAVVYYGFPFPNTAYAKLNTAIPTLELVWQGLLYYVNSADWDPVTLLTIGSALLLAALGKERRSAPLSLGLVLYLLYVLKVGGDFMSGRFFSAPLLLGVIILSRVLPRGIPGIAIGTVLLLTGVAGPRCPLFVHSGIDVAGKRLDTRGIADERLWYNAVGSFATLSRQSDVLAHETDDRSKVKLDRPVPLWHDTIGFVGYRIGPRAHIVDRWALADPLLARLPMAYEPEWRIGHFTRYLPRGYEETLRTGRNAIEDEDLAVFYDKLTVITRGGIFSWNRFREIVKVNVGAYDHLIDTEYYRYPSVPHAEWVDLQRYVARGTPFDAPGNILILEGRPLKVDLGQLFHNPEIEIGLGGHDAHEIKFFVNRRETGKVHVGPASPREAGMFAYQLRLGSEITTPGYDRVTIEPLSGDGRYSLGHIRIPGVPHPVYFGE